jgi:hypothetical protein
MNAPFTQVGYTNVIMPQLNLFANPSAMDPPYIRGWYTSLLMGVDQAAATQDAVRKLHFDDSM